jgi:hypothetical protein
LHIEVKAPSTVSTRCWRQPKEQIQVDQLQWLQIDRNILEAQSRPHSHWSEQEHSCPTSGRKPFSLTIPNRPHRTSAVYIIVTAGQKQREIRAALFLMTHNAAVADATRIRALHVYEKHTQANAILFLDYVVARFPFRIHT